MGVWHGTRCFVRLFIFIFSKDRVARPCRGVRASAPSRRQFEWVQECEQGTQLFVLYELVIHTVLRPLNTAWKLLISAVICSLLHNKPASHCVSAVESPKQFINEFLLGAFHMYLLSSPTYVGLKWYNRENQARMIAKALYLLLIGSFLPWSGFPFRTDRILSQSSGYFVHIWPLHNVIMCQFLKQILKVFCSHNYSTHIHIHIGRLHGSMLCRLLYFIW